MTIQFYCRDSVTNKSREDRVIIAIQPHSTVEEALKHLNKSEDRVFSEATKEEYETYSAARFAVHRAEDAAKKKGRK